jgi:Uma2 family endonuclease
MSPESTAAPDVLTAEEYARRPDPGYPEELVRGRTVPMSHPDRRHGQICNKVGRILGNIAEHHALGHVLNNEAGVITARNPDTVRGPDVSFYSFGRLPKGPLPAGYGSEMPELIIEVRSPSDRWAQVLARVVEYLDAGVRAVVVLDDESRTAFLQLADRPPRLLGPDDDLTVPDILPGFAVAVRVFFE